jgi:pimeloyl-ACP methyl ester carboxylesterase
MGYGPYLTCVQPCIEGRFQGRTPDPSGARLGSFQPLYGSASDRVGGSSSGVRSGSSRHGRSQKPKVVPDVRELASLLREWLRVVGIERAAFVGNSMGCQVIVELAHIDASCIVAVAMLGPTMDQTVASRSSHVAGLLKDQFREPPMLVPLQAFDYLHNGPIRTIRTFIHATRHDMLKRARQLRVPCLILRGEHDEIVSQKWVEKLAKGIPRAVLRELPGAGHALNYNSAETVAPLIEGFWQECGILP